MLNKKREFLKYNDKKLLQILIEESLSFSEVIRKLGGFPHGATRKKIKEKVVEFKIDVSHFKDWGIKLTTEKFIERSIKINGLNRYDYSKSIYKNILTQIILICNICKNEFEQRPHDHLNGENGCSYCGGSKKLTTKEFIERSIILYGSERYNYSKSEYVHMHSKLIIICNKCKNEFTQKPHDHLNGHGCSICNESSGERKIRDFLTINNIKFEYQKKFEDCKGKSRRLPFDFYIVNLELLIEYDGEHHFRPVSFNSCSEESALKQHKLILFTDRIKNEYCTHKKIKLIRIPYWENKNIEKILEEELKNG